MAGQSISDRITAAQHTFIGSDMSKSVCKASTREIMGPKKKHLDYLTALTREQNINIPELADLLVERAKIQSWVVAFKSLISTHHLMCYGNERFIQHLASRQALFNLANFVDKTGVQGYDMSTFVRRYARYLNEKAVSYRTVAYDFTRVKRGKDNGVLRSLPTENLLKTIPTLQHQLDVLLEFQASPNELTNGVVNSAFMLLFKDLIRLFACYNDGIINLLEKYFDMKKHHCKDALDLYKKFLTRMEKVSEFLKVAEQVGIDKGDIPDLTQAPNSLLDALEQHYANLDGKKGLAKPSKTISAQVKEFATVNATFDTKDKEASLIEEEERLRLYKLKAEEQQQVAVGVPAPVATPVSQQQPTPVSGIDWLSSDLAAPPPASNSTSLFGGVDFLTQPATVAFPPQQQQIAAFAPQQQPQITAFPPQQTAAFAPLQQQQQTAAFPPQQQDLFSQQPFEMQPFSQPAMTSNQMFPPMTNQAPIMAASEPNMFNTSSSLDTSAPFQGDLLTPTIYGQPSSQGGMNNMNMPGNYHEAGVGSDLDSSLANVVANLNVGGAKANQNFQPKTERQLTGGMNFQLQPTIPMTLQPTMQPSMQPTMQVPGYQPGMMPQTGMMAPMYGQPMQPYGQPMMGAQPGMRPGMYGQPMGIQPQMNVRQMNPNNPFGPTIHF